MTGVAMLAGLGGGVYRDPAEAIARCVRLEPQIEPDPATAAAYAEAAAAYRALASGAAVRRASSSPGRRASSSAARPGKGG